MQAPIARNTTLADALIPRRNLLLDVALIVGYAALTGLSAQIAVYINPAVPITGQTFAVLLSGAVLGSKRGTASMLVYLGAGVVGLPVFAPEGAIAGASRGYLIGFVLAAGFAFHFPDGRSAPRTPSDELEDLGVDALELRS